MSSTSSYKFTRNDEQYVVTYIDDYRGHGITEETFTVRLGDGSRLGRKVGELFVHDTASKAVLNDEEINYEEFLYLELDGIVGVGEWIVDQST